MLLRCLVFSLIISCVVELEDSFVSELVFLVEIVCCGYVVDSWSSSDRLVQCFLMCS